MAAQLCAKWRRAGSLPSPKTHSKSQGRAVQRGWYFCQILGTVLPQAISIVGENGCKLGRNHVWLWVQTWHGASRHAPQEVAWKTLGMIGLSRPGLPPHSPSLLHTSISILEENSGELRRNPPWRGAQIGCNTSRPGSPENARQTPRLLYANRQVFPPNSQELSVQINIDLGRKLKRIG